MSNGCRRIKNFFSSFFFIFIIFSHTYEIFLKSLLCLFIIFFAFQLVSLLHICCDIYGNFLWEDVNHIYREMTCIFFACSKVSHILHSFQMWFLFSELNCINWEWGRVYWSWIFGWGWIVILRILAILDFKIF